MKKLVFLLFFALFSCNSSKKIYEDISFENIFKSEIGGAIENSFEIIKNNEEFLKAIERLNLLDSENERLLGVDFEKNNVVILHLGEKNTGGYSIEVESLYWKNKVLYIKTIQSKPKAGENVTMVITTPYCITKIPKTDTVVIK